MPSLELQRLTTLSNFAQMQILRLDKIFTNFALDQNLTKKLDISDLKQNLQQKIKVCQTQEELCQVLRIFRNLQQVRLIYRIINKLANYEETAKDASILAFVCVQQAYKTKPPLQKDGTPLHLVIIGMGKLGGMELNLSSDIDLIFAYNERTTSDGHHFLTKLGQKLIKVLNEITADGFVFRVDMRLRPFGSNSSLVLSFDAIANYYQTQGRDWERYALIKAAPIAGDIEAGEQLMAKLKPFVYRRYVDFSAVAAMREMKANLLDAAKRQDRSNNIKLGSGGIREAEFIVQVLQLIYGGSRQDLQQRNFLQALAAIEQHQYLTAQEAIQLRSAYVFLRDAENAIQALNDEQTHDLPKNKVEQEKVATILGFANWDDFLQQLNEHRSLVAQIFADLIKDENEPNTSLNSPNLWQQMQLKNEEQKSLLTDANYVFINDPSIMEKLENLHNKAQKIATTAQERLNKLMPKLLQLLAKKESPNKVLERILPLLHAVLRRSSYLLLLLEKPQALVQLVELCAKSSFIAEQIAFYPALLGHLLDDLPHLPPTKYELTNELQNSLKYHLEDFEQQMEQLRHFKLAHTFKAGAAFLQKSLTLMQTSDYLTWLAEAILQQTFNLAWEQISAKYGAPPNCSLKNSNFAIIGYGKLGSLELGFGSDLDLVFIYDCEPNLVTSCGIKTIETRTFFIHLSKCIINILSTQTMAGKLYEVDLRLRPDGKNSLLICTLAYFMDYQQQKADLWEHQALVKARVLVGDQYLLAEFVDLRQQILAQKRDLTELKFKISDMRQKMRQEQNLPSNLFDLKKSKGGMVDLEFIVQFLALAYAFEQPKIINWTDNIRILDELSASQILPLKQTKTLQQIYLTYRTKAQELFLQNKPAQVKSHLFMQERKQITDLWQQLDLT